VPDASVAKNGIVWIDCPLGSVRPVPEGKGKTGRFRSAPLDPSLLL
jgi:hypothetical protein